MLFVGCNRRCRYSENEVGGYLVVSFEQGLRPNRTESFRMSYQAQHSGRVFVGVVLDRDVDGYRDDDEEYWRVPILITL